MICLTFIGQFFFQAHFQLWQALLLGKNINRHDFYLIYIVFQLISLLAYSLPISMIHRYTHNRIFLIGFVVGLGLILWLLKILTGWPFVGFYVIWVFIFTVFDYLSNYLFSKRVSLSNISSLTSLKSSCGRIGSLLAMMECSFVLRFMNTTDTIILNFAMALLFSLVILYRYIRSGSRISKLN